jgi:trimeric autotransporter adhesin
MIARLFLLLLLGMFAAAPAAAATYTTIANRDSHLRQNSSGSNFGSAIELEIRASSSDQSRPVIGFNLPAIPAGEVITSATLQLYVTTGTAPGTVSIHSVTDSWTEGGVTWANTSADFDPTAETSLAVNALGAVSFDITALVRGWANGTIANNGVMAITNTANGRFASSENGTISRRPLLTINTVQGPVLTVVKSATVFSDPFNGTTNPKAIPGAAMTYTISVSNSANGSATSGSTVITDAVPANMELYVGNIAGVGSGPVSFTNGTPSSGLTYTFTSLGSTTDSISFSNNGGTTYTYTPVPDANGYDANVTNFRINPAGSFAAKTGASDPRFTMQLRMRVK